MTTETPDSNRELEKSLAQMIEAARAEGAAAANASTVSFIRAAKHMLLDSAKDVEAGGTTGTVGQAAAKLLRAKAGAMDSVLEWFGNEEERAT